MKRTYKWLVKAIEERPVAAVIVALSLGLIVGLCGAGELLLLAVRTLSVL